jgi:glycosyltransferase involved in cell wall biosynthesis
MTVYNRVDLVEYAIRSILEQTLPQFELVVVDDGSTDDTASIVQSFHDPRIRFLRFETNRGIPAARNAALQAAQAQYVAWLDSDDIARPNRLKRQVAFLEDKHEIAMVGSCAGKLAHDGTSKSGLRVPPLEHEDIRCWSLFRNGLQQSSICGRTEILRRYPYREQFPVCEDIDVFVRISQQHRIANLPEVLVDRRTHDGQTVRNNRKQIFEAQKQISRAQLQSMGITFDEHDLHKHVMLAESSEHCFTAEGLRWVEHWLNSLISANASIQYFNQEALRFCLSFFWIRACSRAVPRLAGARHLLFSSLTAGALRSHSRKWAHQAVRVFQSS